MLFAVTLTSLETVQPLPGFRALPRLSQERFSLSWKRTRRRRQVGGGLTIAVSFVFAPFFTLSGFALIRTLSFSGCGVAAALGPPEPPDPAGDPAGFPPSGPPLNWKTWI